MDNRNHELDTGLLVQKGVGEDEDPRGGAAGVLKWILLTLVILLAAAAVTLSVLYTRFVSVDEGRWVIDMTGRESVTAEDISRIREIFPDALVRYDVDLGGLLVENTITEITLNDFQGVSVDSLTACADRLPDLRAINVTGLTVSAEQYERLRAAWPEAEIKWTIPAAGGLSPDVFEMKIGDMATLREVAAMKQYLPKLVRVYMNGSALTAEELRELAANTDSYGFEVIWNVTVAGQQLPYHTTSLTLSGSHVTDLTELYKLPMLAQLTLDAIGTGDLSPLVSITTLESITVRNMQVDGIEVLGQMSWLGGFYAKNTNLTYAQLNALQRRLPECIVMMIE